MRIAGMCVAVCLGMGVAFATQANYNSSGGAVTLDSNFSVTGSPIASPPGTLSFSCPVTALPPGTYQQEWICAGGTFTIQSSDGTTSINGTFTSGTLYLTASGGGRGGNVKYYYSFGGNLSGTLTMNGQSQAFLGSTVQYVAPLSAHLGTGTIQSASSVVSSRYEPAYVADTYNHRIVRMDDILGSNWRSLGSFGGGVKQFSAPQSIVVDRLGKIYVGDTGNCRVVRMDDITGKNWTSYGTCGAGIGQFSSPAGLATDVSGRVYIADSGNNRVVRVNDITGAGWVALGSAGPGTAQFGSPLGVAVDSSGKIYVSDSGNSRIVRMDDMAATNWIAFGTNGSGTNQFYNPDGIAVDSTSHIYVADTYNNRVVEMADMSGTNWTVLGGTLGSGTYQFINPYGLSLDSAGGLYIADTQSQRIVKCFDITGLGWTTVGTGGNGVGGFTSPYGVFPVLPPKPVGVVLLSATSLAFPNEVVGFSSPSQDVTLTNIGGAPLSLVGVATTSGFTQTNTCPSSLIGGQSCTFSVAFLPVVAGAQKGTLTLTVNGNANKSVALTGTATLVSISPSSLDFGTVITGDLGKTLPVTITNPSQTAAGISSIALTGAKAYRQTNNCLPSVAPGATCTVTVRFSPQQVTYYTGTLTIVDASGTVQTVSLTGSGGG